MRPRESSKQLPGSDEATERDTTQAKTDDAKGRAIPKDPRPEHFFHPVNGLLAENLRRCIERRQPIIKDIAGTLYRYSDGVWRNDGTDAVKRETLRLLQNRYRISYASTAAELFRIREPELTDETIDSTFLNLPNGLLEWRTGVLHPHSRKVLSTIRIPVAWDPTARCAQIQAWMDGMFTPEIRPFVEEVIGYMLLNDNPLHRAILLYGKGRNGKGTFLRLLSALAGVENTSSVSPQSLDSNRFRAAELFGKLANLVGDVDPKTFEATEIFKQVTGGDRITAEKKHRDPFQFRCRALIIAAFNTLPRTDDASEGFFSRWIVLPFLRFFAPGKADVDMTAKLTSAEELRGLLVVAVAGLQRVMARRAFDLPSAVSEATQGFRRSADPIRSFLAEHVESAHDYFQPRTPIYDGYRTWTRANGYEHVTASEFYEQLVEVAQEICGSRPGVSARNGDRGFRHIRLRDLRENR